MVIKKIGAAINAGCDIDGAQYCVEREQDYFSFDAALSSVKDPRDSDVPILYKYEVLDFVTRLQKIVKGTFSEHSFPLVFGGDHSLAIGSISAASNKNRGVIWIDAHGDFNTDVISESKRIHGMPLANLCGLGDADFVALVGENTVPYENIIYFGIRSLDPLEEALMHEKNLRIVTMKEINEKGYDQAIQETVDFLRKFESVHISFDLDSIDPTVVKGVSTPVPNGLKKEKALELIETVFKTVPVSSMDIVEYNPINDDGKTIGVVLDTLDIVEHYIK